MYVQGLIMSQETAPEGTYISVFLPNTIKDKKVEKCSIVFDEEKVISSDQRRKIYATLMDIARYCGYSLEEAKNNLTDREQEIPHLCRWWDELRYTRRLLICKFML